MADIVLHYGAGQAYTTWQDLRAAAVAINLAGTDQQGKIYLHENITITNNTLDWLGLGIDANHYWRIMPAPGLGWRDLDGGLSYDKPTAGIKITANAGASNGFKASNGFVLDGLILEGTNTTAAKPQFDLGRQSGTDNDVAGIENCWAELSTVNSYGVILRRSPKTIGALPTIFARRNVFVGFGGTQPAFVTQGNPLTERNTIRVPNPATTNGLRIIIGATNHGAWCRDNAVDGGILEEHTGVFSVETAASTASVNNHYSGVFTKTGTGAGYNLAGWINDLTSASFDGASFRPAAGGVLIGAASASAANTPDINGSNSGSSPDVGAIQRSAAAPLATGSITNVVTSGQQVTVTGTQSLAVSGSASLTGSTSGGTVPLEIGAGTFDADFSNVSPGSYSCQVLLYNSEGAVTPITGGSVVINDITGSPEGPEPTEPAVPPVVSSVGGSPASPTTADISVDTNRSDGTMFVVVSQSATTPTRAQIKAGQNHTGAPVGPGRALSQAVGAPGTRTLFATNLTQQSTYYAHAFHEHSDGDSNVASSAAFTQPAVVIGPTITDQPDSVSVDEGDDAVFSVTATGTAPFAYQWRRDGVIIPDEIASSFTLVDAAPADDGAQFTCHVSNSAGSVTSSAAVLTVIAADVTAPILTSPTAAATAHNAASGSVSTNEASGTLYWLASTNATESAAAVKAGASKAVTATGAQSVTASGLMPSTSGYRVHYLHSDAAGNDSAVASSGAFTTPQAPDTTAPTLSGASAAATAATSSSGAVTTNEATGTLYWLTNTSATATASAVKAGSSKPVTAAGAQTTASTGLAENTTGYRTHFLHRDAAGNDSAVATSAAFNTPAATVLPPGPGGVIAGISPPAFFQLLAMAGES